jgi:hypothetical protein
VTLCNLVSLYLLLPTMSQPRRLQSKENVNINCSDHRLNQYVIYG